MVDMIRITATGAVQDDGCVHYGQMIFCKFMGYDLHGDWYRTSPDDFAALESEIDDVESEIEKLRLKISQTVAILDNADNVEDDKMYALIQKALGVLDE